MINQPNGVFIQKDVEIAPKTQVPTTKVEDVKPITKTTDASSNEGRSSQQKLTPKPDLLLRLSIDRDHDSGEWVYRSINRLTGEVVNQYPREEILNMKRHEKYKPGSIIKTIV
jgi:flagellar protein FlaG